MSRKFAGKENIYRKLTQTEKRSIRSDWKKMGYDAEFLDEDKKVIVTRDGKLITTITYDYYTYYCQFISL